MSGAGVQICRGSKFEFDGELFEVAEFISAAGTYEVILQGPNSFRRKSVVDLLADPSARLIADEDGPEPDDPDDPAAIALLGLSPADMKAVREKADHIREATTGYRSGSPELALEGEPRPEYDPARKLMERYDAKCKELGVSESTFRRWVRAYKERGEAGLVTRRKMQEPKIDPRWVAAAEDVMREHTEESMPTKSAVILQASARLELLYGEGVVKEPSRSTANRHLLALDAQRPLFRGTTKRNRDLADGPEGQHGKLRATRPGEYLILDTTRLDVFGFDPAARWMQVELTAAMDWYTRCIVALRLTPRSTKAVDAAALMYQVFRPLPAPATWPTDAVWPYHGIPREVLIDPDRIDRTGQTITPALRPDTIVVDHGKIYLSEHLNSVCQRFGISIQPARLREGRDKAPLERFFGSVRTRLLQYLPGYKGPDINSRGLDVEGQAFFYIHELDEILREWVGRIYHRVPHDSLLDPELPVRQAKKAPKMTPAQMFSHGIARAGYIEVPRHPNLALEFLRADARTIQRKGVKMYGLVYKGDVLGELGKMKSPYEGRFRNAWPIHSDPDDISTVYIQHPYDREWHPLKWEHASRFPMPFSDDAYQYARKLAVQEHGFVDEQFALRELFKRFNLSIELSPKERRIALRIARKEQMLSNQAETHDAQAVSSLSSLRALTESSENPFESGHAGAETGDGRYRRHRRRLRRREFRPGMSDFDPEINEELKNITLITKEGWAKFVNAPKRTKPKQLNRLEIKALTASERRHYNKQRLDWHANLGVVETPPMLDLRRHLSVLMASNACDANRVKGGLAIEGPAGIGKTTAVQNFAKRYHLDVIAEHGPMTSDGHERWPVCWIALNGTPTPRALYVAMLYFIAHPGIRTGNADQFKLRALDAFLDCNVRLLIIDEVHFSSFNTTDGSRLSNTFKSIANDFPITTLFVGVGLSESGFFSEGRGDSSKQHNVRQQTARRVTAHAMGPFEAETLAGRRQWRTLVRAVEKQLVLADHDQRSLASGQLSDYLYVRTQGYFQSLATLITRACALAVLDGQEALTMHLLEQVTIDVAAESSREVAHAKLRTARKKQASQATRKPT